MGLTALVIDPSLESRNRFRSIAEKNHSFEKVSVSSTLIDSIERLRTWNKCDVIYVSNRFDPLVITTFFKGSRKLPSTEDAPHLVVIGRDTANLPTKQFEIGHPDGYLLEPIIPKDLDASVQFVAKFKEQKLLTKNELPTQDFRLLVAKLAVAVDRGKNGTRDLRTLSRRLEDLSPADLVNYYEELTLYFGALSAPTKVAKDTTKNNNQRLVGVVRK
jgi:hypothetical protein